MRRLAHLLGVCCLIGCGSGNHHASSPPIETPAADGAAGADLAAAPGADSAIAHADGVSPGDSAACPGAGCPEAGPGDAAPDAAIDRTAGDALGGDVPPFPDATADTISIGPDTAVIGPDASPDSEPPLDPIPSIRCEGLLRRESVVISSAADVAALRGVQCITGFLSVPGPVADLTGLESLVTVMGTVSINSNTTLTSLAGLSGLKFIGGDLTIQSDAALAEATLSALVRVDGQVRIGPGDRVLARVAFPALLRVGKDLELDELSVTALSFPLLREIGGQIHFELLSGSVPLAVPELRTLGGALTLQQNPGLTSFRAPRLAGIPGTLHVTRNAALAALELDAATSVGDRVMVQQNTKLARLALPSLASTSQDILIGGGNGSTNGNPALTAVDLPALTSTGGFIDISGNAALAQVSLARYPGGAAHRIYVNDNATLQHVSMPALRTMRTLFVLGDPQVATVELPALETVDWLSFKHVGLTTGPRLDSLKQVRLMELLDIGTPDALRFPSLTSATTLSWTKLGAKLTVLEAPLLASVDSLLIDDAGALTTTAGFSGFKTVKRIELANLPRLADLAALRSAPTLGTVVLRGLNALPDFSDLASVTQLEGLVFSGFTRPDLRGLSGLTQITQGILIQDNTGLVSTSGLGALTSVGALQVNGNVGLTTITFPALTTVQNDVEITGNRQLASVSLPVLKDVRAFAARYDDPLAALTLPALETTRGQLDFSSNAQLATIALPAWTTGDALVLEVGPALTAFQAPKVRTLELLKINQNQNLPTIALPSLVRVNTGFFITSNAHLPTCRALALRDQVVAAMGIGGTIQVQGNDDAGVCN